MRWYLLRDRRHEGPYSKEQVAEAVKAGKIDPRDYLLPEQAEKDQSTFAYLSVGDVLGPEFIFDLKKDEKSKAFHLHVSEQKSVAHPSKESLISEFEEGLESTQLIQLRKERSQSESSSTVVGDSFTSQPSEGFHFPWVIVFAIALVLGAGVFIAKPFMDSAQKASLADEGSVSPSPTKTVLRKVNQNRLPTGGVRLPQVDTREVEPESAFAGPKSEEQAEPIEKRKRRKRKPVEAENTDAVDDSEVSSDADGFDDEEYVDEYESQEELDESDI